MTRVLYARKSVAIRRKRGSGIGAIQKHRGTEMLKKSGIELVFLQHVVDRRPGDIKLFRDLGHIATVSEHAFPKYVLLIVVPKLPEGSSVSGVNQSGTRRLGSLRLRQTEVGGKYLVMFSDDHCPVDRVVKFPDISGPWGLHDRLSRRCRQRLVNHLKFVRKIPDQKLRQLGQVFTPFSKGRDGNHYSFKAVIKILPESSLQNLFLQILVGGAYNAALKRDILVGPDSGKASLLKNAKEFDLKQEGKFPDLVKEDCASVRCFQISLLGLVRTGKTPFFVAKKEAFRQMIGNGSAVDRDEWPVLELAHLVNGARENFLARSGFSDQKNRKVRGGEGPDLLHYLLDSRAFPCEEGSVESGRFLNLRLREKRLPGPVDHRFKIMGGSILYEGGPAFPVENFHWGVVA